MRIEMCRNEEKRKEILPLLSDENEYVSGVDFQSENEPYNLDSYIDIVFLEISCQIR